jgi:hypothetical protein
MECGEQGTREDMIFTRRNAGYIIAIALMGLWIGWLLSKMGEQAGGTLTRILIAIAVMVAASAAGDAGLTLRAPAAR